MNNVLNIVIPDNCETNNATNNCEMCVNHVNYFEN